MKRQCINKLNEPIAVLYPAQTLGTDSAEGGGGIQIPINKRTSLFLEGRYNHGLFDIQVSDTRGVKTRTFSLSGGLDISQKKKRLNN